MAETKRNLIPSADLTISLGSGIVAGLATAIFSQVRLGSTRHPLVPF